LLAIHLFEISGYERKVGSWGEIAGKNVRYLHPLEHGGAVGHVGERVDVGVDRVLVHLLGPMGRAEIQVCGKKRWEGEGRGSCTPIENEERGQ